ncbi:MAG: hypothetical protein WC535_08825 [Candidatus Cloacimonas sp.]|jgi:ABC-type transport system involved in multi-copper enzyme maturation permease subunit
MNQCKTLLKKEWWINWKQLLLPVWVSLAFIGVCIIGLLIGLIKGKGITYFRMEGNFPPGFNNLFLFGSVQTLNIALGFLSIMVAIMLADNLINGGFKLKCEILHQSQPVSLTKILSSKYVFLILGSFIVYAVISFIGTLVITFTQMYFTSALFYFGFYAWLQSAVELFFTLIFVCSLFWFFACLFQRKSFFMGILTLIGIELAIKILNYTSALNIPSLLGSLTKFIKISSDPGFGKAMDLNVNTLISIVQANWKNILSNNTLLKLLYSAILTLGGSLFYKRRELI